MAALWYWYVRDTPGEHPGVSPAELALIDADRPVSSGPVRIPGAWKIVLRDRQVLLLTASYFCICYVFYFYLYWGFLYLTDVRGFKLLEGGGLASLWWLSGAVGAPLGGWWCDRLSRRIGLRWGCRWPCLVGCVGCCLAMVAAARAGSPYLAVGFLCLGLAFEQSADAAYWVATMAVSGRHTGAVRRAEYRRQSGRHRQRAGGPAHGQGIGLANYHRHHGGLCVCRRYLVVSDRGRPPASCGGLMISRCFPFASSRCTAVTAKARRTRR
jgi:nitrate/nitrite transporter NarK